VQIKESLKKIAEDFFITFLKGAYLSQRQAQQGQEQYRDQAAHHENHAKFNSF
jgi:hypothetical protein